MHCFMMVMHDRIGMDQMRTRGAGGARGAGARRHTHPQSNRPSRGGGPKGPKFKCQFAGRVRVSSVNSQSEFNTIRKFTSSELMRLLKKEFVQEYY